MEITADNYLPRANGAVYVRINKHKIYFHSGQIVGVVMDRVLYRDEKMKGGIVYRRIRDVVARADANQIVQVSSKELKEVAISIIMEAASDEIDKKFVQGE